MADSCSRPKRRRKSWHKPNAAAPVVMKPVKSIGSRAHLYYDPVTGRRKGKAA